MHSDSGLFNGPLNFVSFGFCGAGWPGTVLQPYGKNPVVNKAELSERIEQLTNRELLLKSRLKKGFVELKSELMPIQIAKRILKAPLIKIKSFLPKFAFRSHSRHK